MLRLVAAVVAFIAMVPPALSQTGPSPGAAQVPVPSGQNSGARIPGQPDNKIGPPAHAPAATTGAGAASPQAPGEGVREQDPAKIPGLPGNKSGPAAKPSSGSPER
jgi:hypothetical protein